MTLEAFSLPPLEQMEPADPFVTQMEMIEAIDALREMAESASSTPDYAAMLVANEALRGTIMKLM